MKRNKNSNSKKTFSKKKDPELEKLERITEEMRSINNSTIKTEEDETRFDKLIDQIIELDPKFSNQYFTLFKFCVVYLENYHSRRYTLIIEELLKSKKSMLDNTKESNKEVSELRNNVLQQIDKTLSFAKLNIKLFIERDDLYKIAFESKVYYKPFIKEFNKIYKEKERSKQEIDFALSILEEVKTKKSSFLILLYRNKENENFLRVFPKIRKFDFSKLNSRFDNVEFTSVFDEYFIKFYDALKPSKKKRIK